MNLSPRCLALVAAVAAASPASAQLLVDARIGAARDSLRFQDDDPLDSTSAAGYLELEYRLSDERLRLSYSLDAASYATPGDWTTLLHDAQAVYRFDLSGSKRLFLATSATWRHNGDAWATSGYRALNARANLELRPTGATTLRFGYRIDGRDFSDLPELNQLEQDGFASALFNFQTRTTLIAEVHLGTKSYQGAPANPGVSPQSLVPGSDRGRGPAGMGPGSRASLATAASADLRAGRVTWLLRVAQSLADRTGLSLQYAERRRFGEVPPVLVTTPVRFFDDGVYDDPYASDARSLRSLLKHELSRLGTARAWAVWERKDYVATPALDPSGEVSGALRADRLWRAGAGWRVLLFPRTTGAVALHLDVAYGFTRHRSNDAFYDYDSHSVGAALSVAY